MASFLVEVKSKMHLYAHERVRSLLEGEYGSVLKGRSIDFEDLRDYVPGDDVKDIDWKATARSGTVLVKRYVAIRKHNILLVVNTGRSMAALAPGGESKRDLAIFASGIIASLALDHGDLVGMMAGDDRFNYHLPLKSSKPHIEHMLQYIYKNTNLNASNGNLERQLDYTSRSFRRKAFLVIVSDNDQITPEINRLLRRLRAQHEILWISVASASGLQPESVFDIDNRAVLPYFVRSNPVVKAAWDQQTEVDSSEMQRQLSRLGIVSERISNEPETLSQIFRLLERQKYARQR